MARFERSRSENRGSRDISPRSDSREKTFEDHMKNGGSRRDSGRGRRDSGRGAGRGRRDSGRGRERRDSGRGRERRDSGRGSKRFGNNRSNIEMTKVICSDCGIECEVPFRPTSSKPVYCSACFEKHNTKDSSNSSGRDLEIINEKLDKIMKALKIR